MRLIGTVSADVNSKGMRLLKTKGHNIPIQGVDETFSEKRVCIQGVTVWDEGLGSYFQVRECKETSKEDCNEVEVSGVIIGILPEKKNARNRRSACLLVRQHERFSSTVLITALSTGIDALKPDNLSVGERISVSGYICYHGKGLHVLYVKTLSKGGEK